MKPVNMLPSEICRARRRPIRVALALAAVAVALTPLAYHSYKLYGGIRAREARRALLEARLRDLTPIADLLGARPTLEKRRSELERAVSARKQSAVFSPYLDEIVRSLPDEIILSEIAIDKNEFVVRGRTSTYSSASDFLKALGATGYFGGPTLVTLDEAEGLYRLELKGSVKAGKAGVERP